MNIKNFLTGLYFMLLPVISAGTIASAVSPRFKGNIENVLCRTQVVKKAEARKTPERVNDEKNINTEKRTFNHAAIPVMRPSTGTGPEPIVPDSLDDRIDSAVSFYVKDFNKRLKPLSPLKESLVKAIIDVEATGYAREYDPMQVSNSGDFALNTLVNGGENTPLVGDFSRYKDIKNAERKGSRWQYEGTGINLEASVHLGIGWLFNKAIISATREVEEGEQREYTIKKGESYDSIARRLGTTPVIIERSNPKLNPNKLKVGQKIIYRQGHTERYISGWRSWDYAVESFNGGGNPNYLSEVKAEEKKYGK